MPCKRCNGTGWLCEAHPDKPFEHDDCPGPGDPCPDCNEFSRSYDNGKRQQEADEAVQAQAELLRS